MGLGTLLRKLADDNGLELDEDELAELGLSDPPAADGAGEGELDELPAAVRAELDILSEPLPGEASGMVEVFLSEENAPSTAKFAAEEKDGLMWYPIIREGQWAVRPGTQGRKKKVPLKVIAGHSKNQRREIGLADLKAAHDDEAIQHVTVPTSHANTTLENTGFIKGMKIVTGEWKDQKTKKMVKGKVLMGGYDIKLPEIKRRMMLGAIANRSAGILYDYVNTETGKSYPAVIEHVALTNKPWITGMISFGRKLAATSDLSTVALSLSDEAPLSDDEYAEALQLSEDDHDFLAVNGVAWDHETSPSWLRTQVNDRLREARAEKQKAQRARTQGQHLYVDEITPYYHCVEAKPGAALITDGYGDDANAWVAGIKVDDGLVEVDEFSKWTAAKKVYMPDDRDPPAKDKEPLSEGGQGDGGAPAQNGEPPTRLQLAQQARRTRAAGSTTEHGNEPPRGGGNMAEGTGTATHNLSEDAQRAIQEAEAKAAAAEERATNLERKLERVTGTVQSGAVSSYLSWLRDPEKGLGFKEELGFGGLLSEVEQLMLADDGEPAVQAEHFATDGNSTGELSLSEALQRVFGALHKATEGKKSLGEMLSQPAEEVIEFELDDQGQPKLDAEGKKIPKVKAPADGEGGTNAGEPAGTAPGKPAAGSERGEELSTEKKVETIAEHSPEVARLLGRSGSANGGGR